MTATRAAVVGLAGPVLLEDERAMLARWQPAGIILFRRNCQGPDQLAALVRSIRAAAPGHDLMVLVDQEGGRVMRLCPPAWRPLPAMAQLGGLYSLDPEAATAAVAAVALAIAADLRAADIDATAAPVLDVLTEGTTPAIGDRSFGPDPVAVATLGRGLADGLLAAGVLPIMKHLPGHGRATVDSHLALPTVTATLDELRAVDLRPFRACRDLPAAMTAHVVYPALDRILPATLSPTVIGRLIRDELGFQGLLLSDDLAMGALEGRPEERAAAALAAGCDLAMFCDPEPEARAAVLNATAALHGPALARFKGALAAARRAGEGFGALAVAAGRLQASERERAA